jgi:hypothetical protein
MCGVERPERRPALLVAGRRVDDHAYQELAWLYLGIVTVPQHLDPLGK